jgi:hypothetical protein
LRMGRTLCRLRQSAEQKGVTRIAKTNSWLAACEYRHINSELPT